MSGALIAGCLWVLAASLVALMPLRWQYAPGLALLLAAPALLGWIGAVHGWVAVLAGLAAVISLFRHPLRYLGARALARLRRHGKAGA